MCFCVCVRVYFYISVCTCVCVCVCVCVCMYARKYVACMLINAHAHTCVFAPAPLWMRHVGFCMREYTRTHPRPHALLRLRRGHVRGAWRHAEGGTSRRPEGGSVPVRACSSLRRSRALPPSACKSRCRVVSSSLRWCKPARTLRSALLALAGPSADANEGTRSAAGSCIKCATPLGRIGSSRLALIVLVCVPLLGILWALLAD